MLLRMHTLSDRLNQSKSGICKLLRMRSSDQKTNEERTKCDNLLIANIKFTDTTGLIIAGLVSLGVLLTLFSSLVLTKYRETPLVKASKPRAYSALLLCSIALFFTQTFLSLTQPSSLVCRSKYCFSYIALGTCWLPY